VRGFVQCMLTSYEGFNLLLELLDLLVRQLAGVLRVALQHLPFLLFQCRSQEAGSSYHTCC